MAKGLKKRKQVGRLVLSAGAPLAKPAAHAPLPQGFGVSRSLRAGLELIVIGLWVLWVGRAYLNLDPQVVPTGNEYGMLTQSNHLWSQVLKCGWCAVWNGAEQGGLPALVDIHGDMLHPIVAVATILFGVVNGSKLSVLAALWLAGTAQWWIAREMKLGLLPRLFTAGVAVAGGHLASRMQTGSYISVLATAMASLFLAGVFHLWRRGGQRAAVLLGIITSGLLVAGQGYVQLAMIGVLPAALFLVWSGDRPQRPIWRDALVSLILGLLLAAPLLVPLAHFAPHLGKGIDPGGIRSAQPLQYLPLNLVIGDGAFYFQSEALGRFKTADLYALYIGWIPVLLACYGLSRVWSSHRDVALFLAAGTFLAFFVASGFLQQEAEKLWPASANAIFVGGFRYPSITAALAVPFILALTAWGLQSLWDTARAWPTLSISNANDRKAARWGLPLQWLIIIPLVYSLAGVYNFSRQWYQTQRRAEAIQQVVSAMNTGKLEWVEPTDNFDFIEPAVAAGLKLSPGFFPVQWRDRDYPKPSLIANWTGPPAESVGEVTTVQGVGIYRTLAVYAGIASGVTLQPCDATGSGGEITVACSSIEDGRLVVQESMLSGWRAWIDGKPTLLLGTQWLEVNAPAGAHTFTFRYLPWDVPLGLGLMILGIAGCVWLWVRATADQRELEPE